MEGSFSQSIQDRLSTLIEGQDFQTIHERINSIIDLDLLKGIKPIRGLVLLTIIMDLILVISLRVDRHMEEPHGHSSPGSGSVRIASQLAGAGSLHQLRCGLSRETC